MGGYHPDQVMATLEDLKADATREAMLEDCFWLHDEPDPECPACQEKAQIAREDEEAESCICGGPDAPGDCRSNGCDPECPACREDDGWLDRRIERLEQLGLTRSDAQSVAMAELDQMEAEER